MLLRFELWKTRGWLPLLACLWPRLTVAQVQHRPTEPTPITCADGLYLIYTSYTRSSTDRQFFRGKSADNSEEFQDLWDTYVGLLQPPPVDFKEYVVVSFVVGHWQHRRMALRSAMVLNDGTLVVNFYAEGVHITGPLDERESSNQVNIVWFMAVPRARLPGRRVPRKVVALEPWIEVNDYPRDFEPLEKRPADEQCYVPRLSSRQFRARFLEKGGEFLNWRNNTHWEGSITFLSGLGSSWTRLFGPEVTFGASRPLRLHSDTWSEWLGSEWGFELLGWFGVEATPPERAFIAGVRPWIARAELSGSDWLATKRHPTLLGSVIPEFGMLLQQGNPTRAYAAWSAPFLWHRSTFYYRTTPYLVREHSAFEVRPGLLWLLKPGGTNVVVTLSIGYRLW